VWKLRVNGSSQGDEISSVDQAEGDLCDMGFAVDAVRCALEVFAADANAAIQMMLDSQARRHF